jgi:hypothetical protein
LPAVGSRHISFASSPGKLYALTDVKITFPKQKIRAVGDSSDLISSFILFVDNIQALQQ